MTKQLCSPQAQFTRLAMSDCQVEEEFNMKSPAATLPSQIKTDYITSKTASIIYTI
jgi:hypothetical protein